MQDQLLSTLSGKILKSQNFSTKSHIWNKQFKSDINRFINVASYTQIALKRGYFRVILPMHICSPKRDSSNDYILYTVFGNVLYPRWEAVNVPSAWDAGDRAHFLMQLRWNRWKQLWQLQTGAITRITSQQTIHSYFSSVSCSIRQPINIHKHTMLKMLKSLSLRETEKLSNSFVHH